MKFSSISTLLVLASISITTMTGCGKKSVAPVAYPNVNQQQAGQYGATDPYNTSQQVDPSMQNGANSAYYGNNGSYMVDDTGEFDAQPAAGNTVPANSLAGDPLANAGDLAGDVGGDLDIGDDLGGEFDIPTDIPDLEPYTPPGGGSAGGYTLSGTFKVDQDSYVPEGLLGAVGALVPSRNQWQATGVAVVGSDLLVTASDKSGLFKKGTVITMNSETGQNWKNIGSKWLGASYPMDATVKGIVFDGNGNVYANDSKNFIYVLSEPSFSVEKVNAGFSDSMDIVTTASGSVVLATSSGLMKYESSALTSGTSFASGVSASGGLGADSDGNVYVVSGNSIKKVSESGSATDVVSDASGAIDVAVTNDGKIFVLTSNGIKMYDSTGKLETTFAQGEYINGMSIATDGDSLFVADYGSSYKDSKILKYSTMAL